MKYKVGDVVKVRSDLSVDRFFNVNTDMVEFKGKVVRIAKAFSYGYCIFEDFGDWEWTNEMFEPLTEEDVKKYLEEYVKSFKDYDIKFEVKKKEPILDEEEKKYLSNFVRPFRDRVKYILRNDREDNTTSFIVVVIECIDKQNYEHICLPLFKTNTMYKGMIPHKEYTLEELGI